MPKHEALTPKAISNRIKAKGLQKLRWYCQMCQKQCRDQNGFKCHLTSESHQRQLLLFAESPKSYMGEFNHEFEKGYLDILRRQFGTKRVKANMVYQEYIKDRNHVHMNSTSWFTLTGFVNYLGKAGICKIDHTEKGWFIQYIDKEEEERRERMAKKQKMDRDDEELIMDMVLKQAEKAREQLDESSETKMLSEPTELLKTDDTKIEFQLPKLNATIEKSSTKISKVNVLETTKNNKEEKEKLRNADKPSTSKKSSLDEIITAEERFKEQKNRKDYWLHEGIVVKIVTKKLGDAYYKQKGVVEKVEDRYTGYVRVFETDNIVKFDQSHLETVIPALGKIVLVVNGAYRGTRATLEKLDEKNFCVTIKILEGSVKGRIVEGVNYEDVSKFFVSD